jgi:hypothetical protein
LYFISQLKKVITLKLKYMNTQEVANRLVQLCREGKNVEAIDELYAENIISIEPKGSQAERTEGKVAVKGKTLNWHTMVEQVHSSKISDPILTGNYFAVVMELNVTMKGFGRIDMNEVAVYEVKDGKIVFEQFFFNMGK